MELLPESVSSCVSVNTVVGLNNGQTFDMGSTRAIEAFRKYLTNSFAQV